MSDFYPPHYPAHNFASPHEPYGHSYYPQPQAYPVERSLYTPQGQQSLYTPQGQQSLYTPQGQQSLYTPQGQHPSWDASKIWEEANGTPSASRDSTSLQTMGGGGERGLGATVIGGGAGAFLGHELGHSKMATLGGVLVGAIAANAFEHHHKKKKEEKRMEHAYDDGYVHGESRSIDDGERSLSRRRSRSLSRDYQGRRSFSRASEGRRSFSRDYDSRRSLDYDRRSEYDRRSSLSRDIEYDRRPASRDYDDRRSEFMESRTSLSREYDDEPRPHHHQHHHHAPRDYDDGYTAVSSRRDSRGDFYAQDDRYSRY